MLSNLVLKIPEEVVFEKVNEEIVLLNLETGVYFGLNAVGSRMWELLVTMKDIDSILECLLGEFDVSGDVLKQDLTNLINTLEEKKLIEVG